jgi:hypothetical protein
MFSCDRCKENSNLRLFITVGYDEAKNPIKVTTDLCNSCLVNMIIRLVNRLPKEDRHSWLKAYVDGVIQ